MTEWLFEYADIHPDIIRAAGRLNVAFGSNGHAIVTSIQDEAVVSRMRPQLKPAMDLIDAIVDCVKIMADDGLKNACSHSWMGLTVLEDVIGGQRIIVVKEGFQRDGVDRVEVGCSEGTSPFCLKTRVSRSLQDAIRRLFVIHSPFTIPSSTCLVAHSLFKNPL
jgi:hypothetical protein